MSPGEDWVPVYPVREDPFYTIVIDRPEKRNAMTRAMWLRLAELLDEACRDPGVAVVLVTGSGGVFSAGDDIGEMLGLESVGEARRYFQAHRRAFLSFLECGKPVVGVVEGPAVGGGGEMLLVMDYVVAGEDSIIGYPEARIGLIPPVLVSLGSLVLGHRLARELALTGRLMPAREAWRLGIVSEVVGAGKTLERARRVAREIMESPLQSHRAVKRLSLEAARPLLPAMDRALEELARLVVSEEAKKRMRGFLEARRRG